MKSRREFIKKLGVAGLILQSGQFPFHALIEDENITKVTILHTNDVHSRIEPFPEDGSQNSGLGGAVKRAALIDVIRNKNKNVLLFDCGDMLQGTPYFNFYGGEVEMKLMSQMRYDAAIMGNHDFDGGLDGFNKILPLANFPILVSNYNFNDTILKGKIGSHKIFKLDEVKIGVFGIGIELKNLVPDKLCKGVQYIDPIKVANEQARLLKQDAKCDYVIALSHLGYRYRPGENKISDIDLAKNSSHIDMILGGHTHTFLKEVTIEQNIIGKKVVINQAGWGGILLGQIDLYFEKNKPGKCISCNNIEIR